MHRDDINDRIRRVIVKATNLKLEQIGDTTSFRDGLSLDSLTLLEIGIDVDYEFGLGLEDERYRGLDTVEQTADLVIAELAARAGASAPG